MTASKASRSRNGTDKHRRNVEVYFNFHMCVECNVIWENKNMKLAIKTRKCNLIERPLRHLFTRCKEQCFPKKGRYNNEFASSFVCVQLLGIYNHPHHIILYR